jgi:hypothetical protein
MAGLRFSPKPHVEVLLRVFDLPRRVMSAALAEGILALDFPEEDVAPIEELNAKANDGELTGEEETELEAYANIGELVAYWQSKVRQMPKPTTVSGRFTKLAVGESAK